MFELLKIIVGLLIVIAIGPLVLLLCLWKVGDRLGSGIERRLLDATLGLLTLQWLSWSLLNIVGGTALAVLGGWMAFHDVEMVHKAVALCVVVPAGVWRVRFGFLFLRSRKGTRN